MRENHAAFRRRRITEAREFFHEVGVGQTVKTVALDALRLVAPRNGEQLRDTRHVAMKGGVETGHLWEFRMTLPKRFDQFDLAAADVRDRTE